MLDKSLVSQMDPPPLSSLVYSELTEFLKSPAKIEEVRTRDNIQCLPQIFSKLVRDVEQTAESQVSRSVLSFSIPITRVVARFLD